VKKGGARLLGRAAVRPFYNIINDLKFRLHSLWQARIEIPVAMRPSGAGPQRKTAEDRRVHGGISPAGVLAWANLSAKA
jgi:hypothetical protein